MFDDEGWLPTRAVWEVSAGRDCSKAVNIICVALTGGKVTVVFLKTVAVFEGSD